MLKASAWVGAATLVMMMSATARAEDVLKPYVVLMLDTSGSMVTGSGSVTGSGPPSCGGRDLRLNHARCAINKIVNSYGDMVFALGRFRMDSSGTVGAGESCDADGDGIGGEGDECESDGVGGSCDNDDDGGEILTALVDGGNSAAARWTDFTCGTCGNTIANDPEIWGADGNTPLDGYMRSASLYWRGLQAGGTTIWPSTSAGFDPIRNDPTNLQFLPTGCDPSSTCVGANCCVSQCRSYITIMLTDGNETCDGNAETPIGGMLSTVIDNRKYRIETKVIGFGISPGDGDIERYAHAGGAADLPSINEGYYANDEASLQLALSQILAGAVKVESCNDLDDDCDGDIDEDFLPPNSIPGKGGSCSNGQQGQCAATGTLQCRADGAGLECNALPVVPGDEGTQCNQLDDDCDGRVDENLACQGCVPTGEVCDNKDNDCDGVIDQICRCSNNITLRCNDSADCGGNACNCTQLTRSCGVGVCSGTETCTAGTYMGCDADPVLPETCNGLDDDCDGLCDGYQLECSTENGPCTNANSSCPPENSSGHPSNNPITENICRPGVRTCALDPSCTAPGDPGFTTCSGEILPCGPDTAPGTPGCDTCDGLDNDCDNEIDENFISQPCDNDCGIGMTQCTNGQLSCDATASTIDDTCDNNDDDCNGQVDEDWICPDVSPANGICDVCDADPKCLGMGRCIAGVPTCTGAAIGVEVCNCADDDCDNKIDEDPDLGPICGAGTKCEQCQCAAPCVPGEFPCPLGKKCVPGTGANEGNNYCVNDPCFNVTCAPDGAGNVQTCRPKPGFPNEPECVPTCDLVNNGDNMDGYIACPVGYLCIGADGMCHPNNCETFPDMCLTGQNCINGNCMSNPCQGVTCDPGQYCIGGACVSSCSDVDCPAGQRCRQGTCETDPCGKPCPFGEACNDNTGECIANPCTTRQCLDDQWCNPNSGQCEDDPCLISEVACPNENDKCVGGTCVDEDTLRPDAAGESHVTVGGGGGCSTTGGGSGLLLALGLLIVRRRRAVGGAK